MALTLTKAREKAKILGIDPRGSKAEITKRLQLYENQPANPSTSEDDKHSEDSSQPCDAIVACTIDPSADDTMITDASQKLKDMVDRGLHVETIRNGVFVGNHQGLEYASCRMRLDEITDRITALERDNKDLKSDNTDLKSDNKNLNSRITDLELSTQGFYKLRSRFLSTYKRDRLGTASSADYQTIGEGNVFAHAGNALRDAELYTRGERTDFPTYKSLYGLHPGIVTMISKLMYDSGKIC